VENVSGSTTTLPRWPGHEYVAGADRWPGICWTATRCLPSGEEIRILSGEPRAHSPQIHLRHSALGGVIRA